MDEIKFRVWYPAVKKMRYFSHGEIIVDSQNRFGIFFPCDEKSVFLSSCEVMRYTGLHDINGDDIYEGDILNAVDRLVKVKWSERCGCWDSDFISYIGKRMSNGISAVEWELRGVIIGNIYKNPELLR